MFIKSGTNFCPDGKQFLEGLCLDYSAQNKMKLIYINNDFVCCLRYTKFKITIKTYNRYKSQP